MRPNSLCHLLYFLWISFARTFDTFSQILGEISAISLVQILVHFAENLALHTFHLLALKHFSSSTKFLSCLQTFQPDLQNLC